MLVLFGLLAALAAPPKYLTQARFLEGSKLTRLPAGMEPLVDKWVQYFTERDRERFQRFINRSSEVRHLIEVLLAEEGVPKQLLYLAMIESGFHSGAESHASAVGPWQFIAETGRRYGLFVSHHVDERRDFVRATRAAARYLRDLWKDFGGKWSLAMAGYNSGENRVAQALRRTRSRDYWTLVRKDALPDETQNYVPKFVAAWWITERAISYGFQHPPAPTKLVAGVKVKGATSLAKVSVISGVPLQDLVELNPHLKLGITPERKSNYVVWVPKVRHRVLPGENLTAIAKRYGTSADRLASLNRIQGDVVRVGQLIVVR